MFIAGEQLTPRLLFYFLRVFFFLFYFFLHQLKLMVFHWSRSDRTSPQVSRTLLGVLAHFISAVVEMVSILSLTSCSCSLFSRMFQKRQLGQVSTLPFMFLRFFRTLPRSWYLSSFSPYFQSVVCWHSKILYITDSFFFGKSH